MATFNASGKRVVRVMGKYLIQTTAGILYYCHDKDKMYMTKLFDHGTDSAGKTFYVELDGYLLYADTVTDFEMEQVGQYEKFYARRLS